MAVFYLEWPEKVSLRTRLLTWALREMWDEAIQPSGWNSTEGTACAKDMPVIYQAQLGGQCVGTQGARAEWKKSGRRFEKQRGEGQGLWAFEKTWNFTLRERWDPGWFGAEEAGPVLPCNRNPFLILALTLPRVWMAFHHPTCTFVFLGPGPHSPFTSLAMQTFDLATPWVYKKQGCWKWRDATSFLSCPFKESSLLTYFFQLGRN